MASTIRNALVAALVTAGLTIPVLGLQLVREGARTHIETHWNLVLIACAAVFVIQLLRPALARAFGGLSLRVPGAERLNFIHRTPTGQRVPLDGLDHLAVTHHFDIGALGADGGPGRQADEGIASAPRAPISKWCVTAR